MINEREELLVEIIIENFSEYIKLSNKRRGKPYIKDKCRVPKKYQTEDYTFDHKNRLIFIPTGEIMISNSKTVGTPKMKKVNGQDIYNQNITKFARNNLIRSLHQYFHPYFNDLKPLSDKSKHPLELELLFYIHDRGSSDVNNRNIDNDNKWIWRKAAQDTLTECKVISDDNPYIIAANREKTIFVSEDESQRLVINIYKLI